MMEFTPQQEKRNLRVFGYGVAILLTIISVHLSKHHGWGIINNAFVLVSLGLVFLTLFNYKALRGFYKQWMKVAHFIGTIITTVILSILYYTLFTIMGIIFRLLKKDLLDRKIDRDSQTYWIERESKPFDKNQAIKQY